MDRNDTNAKKFCARCGAELEDDALFCSECGTPLTKKEEAPQETPKEEIAVAPEPEAMKEENTLTSHLEETKEEVSADEQPPAELPAVEVTKEPVSAEPIAPALQADSAPAAQSAQKFCFRCGFSLPLDAMFCQKCGAPQTAQPQSATTQTHSPTTPSNVNIDVEAFKAGVNKGGLNHVLLGTAVVIGLSVFLPLVSIAGMASLKLMDISNILSFVILAIAAGIAYASMLGKYEISVVTGHGFLLVLLFGIYKYQSKLSEMETNFWTAMAKNAFRADWGFYLIPIAVLVLIVVGLMAGLQQVGKPTEPNCLVERWKQIMLQPVQIHTFKFQGLAWAIAIALLMIFIAMQSDGAKQLGL